MLRLAAASAILFGILGTATIAEEARSEQRVQEGRSVGLCSPETLVCAIMKDGTQKPTSECGARQAGAVRSIAGDCYDAD